MAEVIASLLIGVVVLTVLIRIVLPALYFLSFGDDGFSWPGLGLALVFWTLIAGGGVLAYFIGHLILGAAGG